jgi:hypothetical protein
MANDLVPLRFQPAQDISELKNFLVPNRALSRDEWAVYEEAQYRFAMMDANNKLLAYSDAQRMQARKRDWLVFKALVLEAAEELDAITNEWARDLLQRHIEITLNEHAAISVGLHRTMGKAYERILSEFYPRAPEPTPPVPTFWQILFGGA